MRMVGGKKEPEPGIDPSHSVTAPCVSWRGCEGWMLFLPGVSLSTFSRGPCSQCFTFRAKSKFLLTRGLCGPAWYRLPGLLACCTKLHHCLASLFIPQTLQFTFMALQHSAQLVFSREHSPESRLSHWFLGKILSVWEPFLTFLVSVRYMVIATVYCTQRTHRRHFHVTLSS